ncbi:flagellar hook-length control protein FliK [Paenibacillus methanolicus]|uniref:Flagellar hook-length control protein FliK n=1 Tax=Paenibacillus methanolicus TaxID=582686 RepID=A0A5S5CI35_9BACL|nr:flagellar hook-length control protein FliK [Paenibacillus methanolicus]TYP77673.1 flagellar hook-length control protein FliK [Paenibacillus methanolicus]
MNIGHVMRGLMGDVQQGEGKALELKAGQVVRGVVLQVMDDNEALLQINGSQVRAKLETGLAPGQSALLQVQQPSENGQIVMKTVDSQAAAPSDETVKEWVKSLGLPETKWAGELVRDLRRSGVTLNKQVIGQFMQAAEMKPAKADMQSWMQTAAVAVKRGLPMTEATMKSLHQALSGPPVHELLQKLESGLAQFLGSSKTPEGTSATSAQTAAAKVVQLLAEGADLMQLSEDGDLAAMQSKTGVSTSTGVPANTLAAAKTETTVGEVEDTSEGATNSPARSEGQPDTPEVANAQTRNQLGGALGQLMKWFGVDHERLLAQAAREQITTADAGAQDTVTADVTAQGAKGAEQQRASQQGSQAHPSPSAASGQPGAAVAAQTQQTVSTQPSASSAQISSTQQVGQTQSVSIAQPQQGTPVVPTVQHQLASPASHAAQPQHSSPIPNEGGATKHEGAIADQTLKAAVGGVADRIGSPVLSEKITHVQGQILQGTDLIAAGPKADPAAPTESLKHALMLLAGSDDVPPVLKETAQQLIQQITGQQLLLSPERNGSPFTHVTMFIPLKTADGDQTASIHIQTRRGRKGELDAENCRLMFDLRMKSLGDTIVDVQVVDKIVSLRLWNDHPAIESLLDGSRAEITEALKQAGYQLSSLRSTPMPDRLAFSDTPPAAVPTPVQAAYASKPYKGVDYRA